MSTYKNNEVIDADITNPSLANNNPPTTNFFANFRNRVGTLFTTTLSKGCNCSSCLNPSKRSSKVIKINFLKQKTQTQSNNSQQILTRNISLNNSDLNVTTNLDSIIIENQCTQKHALVYFTAPLDISKSVYFDDVNNNLPLGILPESITFDHLSISEDCIFHIANQSRVFYRIKPIEECSLILNDLSCDTEVNNCTIISELKSELIGGIISEEEYCKISSSIIASTIPRNLSDTFDLKLPQISQVFTRLSEAELKQIYNDFPSTSDNIQLISIDPEMCQSVSSEESKKCINDKEPLDLGTKAFVDMVIEDAINVCSNQEDLMSSFPHENSILMDERIPNIDKSKENSNNAQEFKFSDLPALVNYDGIFDYSTYLPPREDQIVLSRRTSSLKSEQSPFTKHCRKFVRFADALGLDLESVRQVVDTGKPPDIPASATSDLHLSSEKSLSSIGAKQFQLCFSQPGASSNFLHIVHQQCVCLEHALIETSKGVVLTGTVRVKNLSYEKHVTVRITYNNWSTFCEVPASYVMESSDGITDRFAFSIFFPSSIVANERAQFAIRYQTQSDVFWDSNHGKNYEVICYAKATDMAGDGSWLHYL